jgi:hypothetical protein
VVPPGDWRGLERAVRDAERDRAELRARGLRARRAAGECFSFEQAAARYVRLVAHDLAPHGAERPAPVAVGAGTSGT